MRYVLLRALLVICLALPFVQPRIALQRRGGLPGFTGGRGRRIHGPSNRRCIGLAGGVAPFRCGGRGRGDRRRRRAAAALDRGGHRQAAAGCVVPASSRTASHDHDELQQVITGPRDDPLCAGARAAGHLRLPVAGDSAAVRGPGSADPDRSGRCSRTSSGTCSAPTGSRRCAKKGCARCLWFHPGGRRPASRGSRRRAKKWSTSWRFSTTGSRRTYVNALLAFADAPSSVAAPAFARRRHLVRRLVLISKEVVMSGRRVVVSAAAVGALVWAAPGTRSRHFLCGSSSSPADSFRAYLGPLRVEPGRSLLRIQFRGEPTACRRSRGVPPDRPGRSPCGWPWTKPARLPNSASWASTLRQNDGFTVNLPGRPGDPGAHEQGTYRGSRRRANESRCSLRQRSSRR